MDRRSHLIDAAIAVLSRGGARSLTHRAVDETAGLTSGSTSNVFRTRQALVTAVVDELLARSTRRMEAAFATSPTPGSAAAAFVEHTLDEARDEVRARMALLTDPDAGALRSARERLLPPEMASPPPGHTDANRLLVAVIDGILLDAVLLGQPLDGRLIDRTVTALVASLRAS